MDVLGAVLDHLIVFVEQWWILIALLAIVFTVRWPAIRLPSYVGRVLNPSAAEGGRFAAADGLRTRPTSIKPMHAYALVFIVALLWIVSPVLVHGVPLPWMHDDYSCLLGAEMVAQGHTSYPPHPMWRHFETMHQLQVPRRASKYPPGQALLLAAGIRFLGLPIAAEWLITALAAAAICWAAFAWTEAGVALVAGLVAAIHPALLDWGEAYRGGGLAAFAGALVIGSTGRLMGVSRVRDGCLFGIGVVLLAISRPYEGLALTIACAAVVIYRFRFDLLRPALFAALIVAIGMVGLGLWNRSITGSPLVMPYMVYERQYASATLFTFQTARPQPPIANEEMARMYRIFLGEYRRAQLHPIQQLDHKAAEIGRFWFGSTAWNWMIALWPLLLLSLAGLAVLFVRSRTKRPLILIAAVFMVALLLIGGWTIPLRYAAPAAAAAWILLVSSVMTLATMFPHHRGQVLALLIGLTFVVNACGVWWNWTVGRDPSSQPERSRIEQSLRADGKRNLILVAPDVYDFVYNHADIDAQDVVWARDLGPAANQSLLRYYGDRVVWTLTNGPSGRLLVTRIQNVDRAGGLH